VHIFFDRFRIFLWGPPPRGPLFLCWFFLQFLLFPVAYILYPCGFKIVRWFRGLHPYKSRFAVVSIGNISVGGSGKSVAVRYFLSLIGEEKCAVVMRGYGGKASRTKKPTCVASQGDILCDVAQAGDEAYALALSTKALVVVGGDKAASVAWCELQKKQEITHIILDDGHQSWSVARDLDVVLVDGRAPLGNGHPLPLGPLREKDLSRADLIIITHAKDFSGEKQKKITEKIQPLLGRGVPIVWSAHHPAGVKQNNVVSVGAADLQGKDVVVLAGIGHPKGVVSSTKYLGMNVCATYFFPDHHSYSSDQLTCVVRDAAGRPVITTEKDWVKIAPLRDQKDVLSTSYWWVLTISLAVSREGDALLRHALSALSPDAGTEAGGSKKGKTC
jgi:tetraacyldisaccharide 4'-kinase